MESLPAQPEPSPVDSVEDRDVTATVLCANNGATPLMLRPGSAPLQAAPMPEVDTVLLGRWRIIAWAGMGSASVVFRGTHVDLDLPVAVKIVNRADYPDRAKAIGHLRNEAQLLKRLRHPNIVRLWDFHNDPDCPCLVTDFVEGLTLGETIRNRGRLERRQAIRAAISIIDALAYAWEFGIVHRDIKPDNLLLAPDGTAKLIDFGLAAVVDTQHPPVPMVPANTWIGTAAYLAPEQARSTSAVDHRADIYALGATLFHALTGRLPFEGKSITQVILRRMKEEPPPAIGYVAEIGTDLSQSIERMMARHPQDRYQTYGELKEALLRVP